MSSRAEATSAERIPPHNEDAEKAVLGSILLKPSALDQVATLEVDDFFMPVHREIYDAMRTVARRDRTVDVVMVQDELKAVGMLARLPGGAIYLNDLANGVPTAENIEHYAGIVAKTAMARRVIATCAQISTSAYGDWTDTGEMLAEFRDQVARLELRGTSASRRIGEDIERVLDQMEKRGQNPDKYGITTGIKSLDDILGPMRPDNLIAIGANPSKGKTALAWNTALRVAARGIPVLYITLEMSGDQLIERGIAVENRIDTRRVSRGLLDLPEWKRITRSLGKFNEIPLWINDSRMTAKQLIAELRVWRARVRRERFLAGMDAEQAELALGVVDYAQLVENDIEDDSRYEAMGKISRALKLASKKNDCNMPIMECLQLNRENMKSGAGGKVREPILSDLRDAGNFEQDADAILFPWWVGFPKNRGRAENGALLGPIRHPGRVLVRKNRNGAIGDAKVIWMPEFTIWDDRTEEDETTEEDA